MFKFIRLLAAGILALSVTAALPEIASAQHFHGGFHHGGGFHGGFHRFHHGGFGPGFALGFGIGAFAPYYAAPYYYDYGPDCGWVPVRYWRHGYWHVRRVWRCF